MKNNVGTVFDSVEYNKYFFEWNTAGLNKKCLSCNLLPVCQGGCRAGALGKLPVTCMRDKEIVDDIIKLTVYAHVDNCFIKKFKIFRIFRTIDRLNK